MEELIADLIVRARTLTQPQDQVSAALLRAAADRLDAERPLLGRPPLVRVDRDPTLVFGDPRLPPKPTTPKIPQPGQVFTTPLPAEPTDPNAF